MNEKGGFMIMKVIYELTKFEIADIMKAQGGKMNISEITKVTRTDADKLDHFLRFATSRVIFRVHDDGVYANNSQSLILCKDYPNTISNTTLLYEAAEYYSDNKKEQMTPFAKAHNAMIEQDNIDGNSLYQDYDWSQYCNTKFVDAC
ncbi:7133_t:CDS:2 [Gigaspora rosea]|nr:7133_t:CDS:2 [Gigaspora rosea]